MKKYWTIFRVELENTIAYRGASVIWMIFDLTWMVLFPFIWLTIARTGPSGALPGWTSAMIVTYYVFLAVLNNLVFMHPEVHVATQIYNGNLSNYLVKPAQYVWHEFFGQLAWKVTRTVLFMPVFVIVVVAFSSYIDFHMLTKPLVVLGAMMLAIPIYFFLALGTGLLAFWFEEPWPSRSLFWISTGIFGGMYAPLDLLPHWLSSLANALPFKYAIAFPLQVFIGQLSDRQIIQGLLLQGAWIVLLGILIWLMWKCGLRRYSAIGR